MHEGDCGYAGDSRAGVQAALQHLATLPAMVQQLLKWKRLDGIIDSAQSTMNS